MENRKKDAQKKEASQTGDGERYRLLVENTQEAIVVLQDGTVKFANPRAAQITGYTNEEICSRPFIEFVYPEDRKGTMENYQRRLKGEKLTMPYQLRVVDKSGSVRWMETNAVLTIWDGKPADLVFMVDVTERKKVETTLRENEEIYRGLFENAPVGYLSVDSAGTISKPNKAVAEMLGYSKDALTGKHVLDLYFDTQPEKAGAKEFIDFVSSGGEVWRREEQMRRSDGTPVWVSAIIRPVRNANGQLLGTHGILMDITERKKAEKAIDESEERYRSLFQHASMGIFHSTVEGKFLRANPALSKMLGYESPEEMVASITDIASQLYADSSKRAEVVAAVMEKDDWLYTENRYRRKDGAIIDAKVAARRVMNQDGTLAYIEGFIEDITEHKKADEEIKNNIARLNRAMEQTINALALMAEMKDPYTAGHQHHVAQLSVAIAREMGFAEKEIEGIHMAALVHDIGKIQVPAEILSKPGHLSEMEFDVIKVHSESGYNLLKTIDFPWAIAQFVLQHHERLDGSGYPDGLAGDKITLEAKILGVADVVEAMSSHRPYRPAWGVEKALLEILSKKGKLYDGRVVDACMRLFTQKGFKFE